MAQYPDDEFDHIEKSDRRGAHRAAGGPISQGAAVALISVLAIVALLLVVGAVRIISQSGTNPEDQVAASAGDDEGTSQTAQASSSAKPSETGSSDSSGDSVDKSGLTVGIYNASGTTGAAAKYSSALKDSGWTIGKSGNYSYSGSTSVIFYSKNSQEDAAKALAKEVGAESVKKSSRFSVDLALVLCSDLSDKTPSSQSTGN